jgi:hypothetical protein
VGPPKYLSTRLAGAGKVRHNEVWAVELLGVEDRWVLGTVAGFVVV